MLDEATRIDPLSHSSRLSRPRVASRPPERRSRGRMPQGAGTPPGLLAAIVALGRCYEAQGRYDESIACFERAKVVSDRVPSAIGGLGWIYALTGRREEAYKQLDELEELARSRYVSPWGRVLVFLGLGDDRVFEWLQRSCDEHAAWVMYLAPILVSIPCARSPLSIHSPKPAPSADCRTGRPRLVSTP